MQKNAHAHTYSLHYFPISSIFFFFFSYQTYLCYLQHTLYLRFASYVRDGCCVHVNSRDADFSWLEIYGFTVGGVSATHLVYRRTRAGPCNESGSRYLLLASSIWSKPEICLRFSFNSSRSAFNSSRQVAHVQDTRGGKTRASRETGDKRSWNVAVQSFDTYIGILYFKMSAVFRIGLLSASIITISDHVLPPIDSSIFQKRPRSDIESRCWPRCCTFSHENRTNLRRWIDDTNRESRFFIQTVFLVSKIPISFT